MDQMTGELVRGREANEAGMVDAKLEGESRDRELRLRQGEGLA